MGKYPASKLRSAFSDWHFNTLHTMSTGMDIDFIETKTNKGSYEPVAIMEIHRVGDRLTEQELNIYLWLNKITKLPVYVVSTDESFNSFNVWFFPNGEHKQFTEEDFIIFEDHLRGLECNKCNSFSQDNALETGVCENRKLCAPIKHRLENKPFIRKGDNAHIICPYTRLNIKHYNDNNQK